MNYHSSLSDPPVALGRDGGIALLTVQDPARRNALGPDALELISGFCDEIDADPAIGALVVRGAGGNFCSGAARDLLAGAGADPLREDNYALLGSIYESVGRIGAVGVPVIAAVRGAAVGAGLNLAMAADVRVVAADARLLSGFLPIGLHPGGGNLHLLMRAAGREAAAAVTLLGEPLSGERAAEVGLAWEALPDDEVEPRALEMAARVANDPMLSRAMKRSLVNAASITSWPVAIDAERSAQMRTLRRKQSE